ncbi:MAG: GH92 family glycosyl hydrolase, partial [Cyclobacteriaceae bacterium]|nr:GH92 family glycosyl hydrolase [Cyclobacteriaceae bacterium]
MGVLNACIPSAKEQPGDSLPDLVQYVNPLMGTASTFEFSHGNLYPAIGLPWGMNSWTPQTGELGSGWIYQYLKDSINGFRQTHQPSPWMNDYGTFAIMPVTGQLRTSLSARASSFLRGEEAAMPHFYRVNLKDHQVIAEVVPAERAAMLLFTPQSAGNLHLVLDIFNKGGAVEIHPEERKITGYTRYNSGGVPENFANYFELQIDAEFVDYGVWIENELKSSVNELEVKDKHAGCYVTLGSTAGTPVEVRCASSFISPRQAGLNLTSELGERSFDELKQDGFDRWNIELNRIRVETTRMEKLKTFYTTLYRSLLFPRQFYEFNEEGTMIHYSPYDGKIHEGYMYADNGFWDTFRAVFPFFNLMYPEENAAIMQWLVNAYEQGGWLPIWPSPGYRKVMIGAHGASLFADAMVKGIRDFDMEKALEAVMQDAFIPAPSYAPGRDGMEDYNQLGYVPYPDYREASAKTLEYAYDDFCIRQMAGVLGRDSLSGVFEKRAYNYKNVFHEPSKLMRGRRKDGSFITEFSPVAWGGPFTEGNAWHYTWSVFHDPQGLIDLMGGGDNFILMMDSVFNQPPDFETGTYPYEIHEITEMVAAGMGQYAHGNQPIQHMIYLYNYAGQPWKAQYRVREVMDKLYHPVPEGYCGDEDNGQSSAWYVFSALGFYPVCPGIDQYVFGSPLFEKVTLQLQDGKSLTIEARGDPSADRYIRSVMLNGQPYRKTWISHGDLLQGGSLVFEMTGKPADPFDDDPDSLPYSMSA